MDIIQVHLQLSWASNVTGIDILHFGQGNKIRYAHAHLYLDFKSISVKTC